MKSNFISFLVFSFLILFLPIDTYAQFFCNVYLKTQTDVDEFSISHPNCSYISVLTIQSDTIDPVTSLVPLNEIKRIRTFIIQNTKLTNLEGLANLFDIGSLIVLSNENLSSLKGLYNTPIYETLYIDNNPILNDFYDLRNVTSLSEDLIITDNPSLIDIDELKNLKFVGNNISIHNNSKLESINALRNLNHLKIPNTEVYNNPILNTCE